MEQLTAFEFVAAKDGPHVVRLCLFDGTVVRQFVFFNFIGFHFGLEPLMFESKEDLVIEGEGLGHPFWNDEQPTWVVSFDAVSEASRVEAIRKAAAGMLRSIAISLH